MTMRIYQYQTACFDRQGDFDQPQQGEFVIQRLVGGQWRNYLWPYSTREAAVAAARAIEGTLP